VQDSLGALTIGDGYLLRSDRVAVALIELTPPDLRLYDTDSLTRLLGMYSDVLKTCPDRCSLATFALPLTITPLIQTLGGAHTHVRSNVQETGGVAGTLRYAAARLLIPNGEQSYKTATRAHAEPERAPGQSCASCQSCRLLYA
jgi:hypothetical protein